MGQFVFQNQVVMDAVSKAGSESEVIGAGLLHIQVFKKDAGFDALLRKYWRRTRTKQISRAKPVLRIAHTMTGRAKVVTD